MNPEDDEAEKRRPLLVPPALDMLGIAELRSYTDTLKAEIGRVEAVISAKDAQRNAAAALFKVPPGPAGSA